MPETRPRQKNQTVAVSRQAVLSLIVSEQRRKFITIQNANLMLIQRNASDIWNQYIQINAI